MTDKIAVLKKIIGSDSSLTINLEKMHPGMPIVVQKTDGSSEELEMDNFTSSFTDNPMTGKTEVTLRLTLNKPLDEES